MTDPTPPSYPLDTGLNVTPADWFDVAVGDLMVEDTAARRAMRANAPVRTVNGEPPDVINGNVDIPATRPTKDQVRTVLLGVFDAGDHIKISADPISGNVRIDAHNIGSTWTVNGQCGHVVITKADLGLDRVDNTSDLEKPVSNATRAFINQVRNELIQMVNDLRIELRAYIDYSINTLRTQLTQYIDTKVSALRIEVTNWLTGKSNVGHQHVPADITGLDDYLDKWTPWRPLQLINGWHGQAYARTNGYIIVLAGEILPGTSVVFAQLPSGYRSDSTYSVGYGCHVVNIKDRYGNTIPGGNELRTTRVELVGATLAVNGYITAVNGHQLDGVTIYVNNL